MSLAGKVAIVTGASNGIGKAIAQRLAADGASVVINYRSDAASAEALAASIGEARAVAVQADVSTVAGNRTLVEAAVARFGRVDVVVPNAGVMAMRTLEAATEADFDASFALNVKGPLFLAQAAAPHMAAGGRIVFVSTGVAHASTVQPAYLIYAATKGAVEQLVRVLAKELGARGITVNAVGPGPTGTELFYQGKSQQMIDAIAGASPFKRLGEPEEQADVVAFLCGDGARWVSGQTVLVNGAAFV